MKPSGFPAAALLAPTASRPLPRLSHASLTQTAVGRLRVTSITSVENGVRNDLSQPLLHRGGNEAPRGEGPFPRSQGLSGAGPGVEPRAHHAPSSLDIRPCFRVGPPRSSHHFRGGGLPGTAPCGCHCLGGSSRSSAQPHLPRLDPQLGQGCLLEEGVTRGAGERLSVLWQSLAQFPLLPLLQEGSPGCPQGGEQTSCSQHVGKPRPRRTACPARLPGPISNARSLGTQGCCGHGGCGRAVVLSPRLRSHTRCPGILFVV